VVIERSVHLPIADRYVEPLCDNNHGSDVVDVVRTSASYIALDRAPFKRSNSAFVPTSSASLLGSTVEPGYSGTGSDQTRLLEQPWEVVGTEDGACSILSSLEVRPENGNESTV